MSGLEKVVFRFGGEFDVRYLPGTPEESDFVSHGKDLWIVESVETNALGETTVVCEPAPSEALRGHDG